MLTPVLGDVQQSFLQLVFQTILIMCITAFKPDFQFTSEASVY